MIIIFTILVVVSNIITMLSLMLVLLLSVLLWLPKANFELEANFRSILVVKLSKRSMPVVNAKMPDSSMESVSGVLVDLCAVFKNSLLRFRAFDYHFQKIIFGIVHPFLLQLIKV